MIRHILGVLVWVAFMGGGATVAVVCRLPVWANIFVGFTCGLGGFSLGRIVWRSGSRGCLYYYWWCPHCERVLGSDGLTINKFWCYCGCEAVWVGPMAATRLAIGGMDAGEVGNLGNCGLRTLPTGRQFADCGLKRRTEGNRH